MSKVGGCALGAAAAVILTSAVATAQTITFENDALGKPPKDFEFGLAGEGGPGRWEVVADKTAAGGKALAQLTTNTAANRFLVAIYNPTVFANGEITTRCKPVSGRVDQACGLDRPRGGRAQLLHRTFQCRSKAMCGSIAFATDSASSSRPRKISRSRTGSGIR